MQFIKIINIISLVTVHYLVLNESVMAQRYALDQGSIRISGSISYANYGGGLFQRNVGFIETSRINEFSFRPSAAYFIIEQFAVGIDFSYTSVSQTDKENTITIFSTETLTAGGVLSYFWGQKRNPVFPFLSAGIGYQSATTQDFLNDINSKRNGYTVRVSAGLAVLFGKQASLNFEAYFRSESTKEESSNLAQNGNVFGIEIGASLFIF